MRSLFLLAALALSTLSLFAQNVVYDENAEVRSVGNFNGVEVSGAISLYLSQGSSQGVAVSAGDAKYNNKIKTEVRNGVLRISVEGGVWNDFNWTNRKLRAYVTAVDLNKLEVSGASVASISETLKSDELKIDISGASEVKGNIRVGRLDLDVSGASVAKLTGTVKEGSIDASGAARVNSYDLIFDRCKVSGSGASSIKTTINGELNANASGGSNIYYKGSGVVRSINTSGGSSIKSRGGDDD